MKYRIKQIKNTYYLQKKLLLFWKYIRVRTWDSSFRVIENGKMLLRFKNLESAKEELNNYRNNYLRPFICLGHIIKTYFDAEHFLYYYIDIHHCKDKIYSTSSERVCELIFEYEESKKPIIHNID